MFRRSLRRLVGYTPVNPDTSPMVQYSNYHWHYNLPQGMEAPRSVNRRLPAPFHSPHRNVNKYKGVWIGEEQPFDRYIESFSSSSYYSQHNERKDGSSNSNSGEEEGEVGGASSSSGSRNKSLSRYSSSPVIFKDSGPSVSLLPLAYQVALEPVLKKLPHGRVVPSTPVEEAVRDFETMGGPLLQDEEVREVWLSKVMQLCAFARKGDVAMRLWETYVVPQYTQPPQGTQRKKEGVRRPSLPLVKAILFACSKSDHKGWRGIFEQCMRRENVGGWNYTPYFETSQWSYLLKSVGRQGDGSGVRLVLEEMLDVKADLDRLESRSLVFALNAITTQAGGGEGSLYNFAKKFLFHLGEEKIKYLRITYSDLRGHGASKLRLPLNPAENDDMYYHVCWHESIRLPRRFSPRQLYFDHQAAPMLGGTQDPNAKIDDIVKTKIEKWKADGLLPQDYVHEDRVYDKTTAFKNVARQENWKKAPRILKSRRFGYTGD